MFAVIQTGGKQYRVTEGATLRVEKLDANAGDTIQFDQVLCVGKGKDVAVGTPFVKGGSVKATVKEQGRSRKIDVVKFKRRKGYQRLLGHRQMYTEVLITGITGA